MGERVVAGPRSPKCGATRRRGHRCWLVAGHDGPHESQDGTRWGAVVALDRRADTI